MAKEIERRFLVPGGGWPEDAAALPIRQGYFVGVEGASIRIRRAGERACVTIKGPAGRGVRLEFEYPIPVGDAEEMLGRLCARPPVEKTRHAVDHRGQRWVVDVFGGRLAGLVLAEAELEDAAQPLDLPPWLGREVTGDPAYDNVALAMRTRDG